GKPVADFGRDLALLRVREGIYPAIRLGDRDARIGDPVHIIGFPGVVLSHELLNKSATLEASVTNGAVSGYKQDAIGQDFIQTDLTDVKHALAEAERKLKNPPPQPFPWAWATLGVTVLSAGVYGGMLGRRLWKNRYRIVPAQVIGAIEAGRNPKLVDVRTKTDFDTSPLRLPGAVRLDPDAVLAGRPDAEPRAERDQLIVVYDTTAHEAAAEEASPALRP